MKYKVVLQSTEDSASGNYPGLASVSFYTKAQALACAQDWINYDAKHISWMWDGTRWNEYKN